MKLRYILFGLVMILSLSACEKEIVLTDEHRTDRLTINAIVNPDTVVYAYVTEANEIDYFNLIYMRADYYHYNKISADKKYMYLVKELSAQALRNAKVELVVNDRNVYTMVFDSIGVTYNSEYVPKFGDVIKIVAESNSNPLSDGSVIGLDRVEANTQLPTTTPRLYVMGTELKIKAREYYKAVEASGDTVEITDMFGSDTVMRINLKIVDPVDEKNYYRLIVKNVGKINFLPNQAYPTTMSVDYFGSEDPIFYDSDLIKPYGFLPAYFSNVFSDELINGKEYEFTVETRMRANSVITPYVILELPHLSPDLYYYLKDIEIFRISDFDLYTNPIQIWSNVNGGWGVFGAMTYDTHIIPFER